jgi:hypothetical protein
MRGSISRSAKDDAPLRDHAGGTFSGRHPDDLARLNTVRCSSSGFAASWARRCLMWVMRHRRWFSSHSTPALTAGVASREVRHRAAAPWTAQDPDHRATRSNSRPHGLPPPRPRATRPAFRCRPSHGAVTTTAAAPAMGGAPREPETGSTAVRRVGWRAGSGGVVVDLAGDALLGQGGQSLAMAPELRSMTRLMAVAVNASSGRAVRCSTTICRDAPGPAERALHRPGCCWMRCPRWTCGWRARRKPSSAGSMTLSGSSCAYSRPREELAIRVVITPDTKDRITDAVREL